jgi:hypothetical protein
VAKLGSAPFGVNRDDLFGRISKSFVKATIPRWFSQNGTWDESATVQDLAVVVAKLAGQHAKMES